VKKLNAISLVKLVLIVITLNIVFAIIPSKVLAQQSGVNFQVFYNELHPYGQWIEDFNHGYIWIPSAGPDFVPYLSNGHWLLTDYGWMWASDYDWGWAPFHYGRWDYNNFYGWYWVPDNEWGPSWVTWRMSEGFFGWAPMRPGVSINITFGKYYDLPFDRWVFVRDRDIERRDIGRNFIDRKNNRQMINRSTVIDKTYYDDKRRSTYVSGPEREIVEKKTGKTVKPIAVYERDRPGQSLNNDQLQIYRPRVEKNGGKDKPAPTEISKLRDVKRPLQRETLKNPANVERSRNNNVDSQRPTQASTPNKIDIKSRDYQPIKATNNEKDIRKIKPAEMQKVNLPSDKRNNRAVSPAKNLERSKTEYKEVRAAKPENIPTPKVNNTVNQQSKARAVNPTRSNNKEQPAKSSQNEDKKENRKR